MNAQEFQSLALSEFALDLDPKWIRQGILIRLVEEKFLELFAEGKMNGTVHTCVGQEFSAVAVAGQLDEEDWVTSNHRCHGHFISKTGKWEALIDELMGLKSGACLGVGSSQHLYHQGFLSNGPQAALVPVAVGIALHNKLHNRKGISVSYIGEGTLGEGALYEAMNLASLYEVPHLIVCENNLYSQSTPQAYGVSGEKILARAAAFGIKTFEGNTWDPKTLLYVSKEAIDYVRTGRPAFLQIKTYRLNAHSKGDDNRNPDEVAFYKSRDPLTRILSQPHWEQEAAALKVTIDEFAARGESTLLSLEDYLFDQLPRVGSAKIGAIGNPKVRMIQALNEAYRETLEFGSFHIGEDIEDPYGGAFKVTKGLSTDFPGFVRNTPISEAGLLGVAIGMSIMGTEAFAEIMFGDFMTHTFDQLISNASKMHHMYAFNLSAPVRIRTPMGGKRGYGPTHSQSLEKHFLGIDNVGVIALTSLIDPRQVIRHTKSIKAPLVIIENKVDYGKYLWQGDGSNFLIEQESSLFGAIRLTPTQAKPTITILSYGETARHIADNLERFFVETDTVPELVCLLQLHPLNLDLAIRSVKRTQRLLIVEDGSTAFGIGAEVLGRMCEECVDLKFAQRIGAEPVPIPSIVGLENQMLPTIDRILHKFHYKKGSR